MSQPQDQQDHVAREPNTEEAAPLAPPPPAAEPDQPAHVSETVEQEPMVAALPTVEPSTEPATTAAPPSPPPPPNPVFDEDVVDDIDNDSGLGEEDDIQSTSSLYSSIMKFKEENGRTYNSYGDRTYVLPNDEVEMDRLDFQHHLLRLTFHGALALCPIDKDKPALQVLDVGTGTGVWSIEFAEEHPDSLVTGVDISPIQPGYVPPNVKFEIDDLEKPWTFSHKFDFIMSRMMTGAFLDWRQFIRQSYHNLTPGGYFEIQDVAFPIRMIDDSLSKDSALYRWANYMLEASTNLGSPLNTAETSKTVLEETGFVDVFEKQYKWPQNKWPADRHLKELGLLALEDFTASLNGISVALFTRGLGWSPTELDLFLIDVRKDLRNTAHHGYWPIYSTWGRKPMHGEII